MKTPIQLAIIGIISAFAAVATYGIKGAPARKLVCEPALLKSDEVCLQQIFPSSKVLWVDARLRKDWQRNGMPGSVLWNLDPAEDLLAFEAEIALKILETPKVVVYCGDENCGVSRQVAERIRGLQLGAEVSVLHGGWRALNEAGLAIPR
jgi:rhodanese-related sulfurtransferase